MKKIFTLTMLFAAMTFTAMFAQAQSRQTQQRNNQQYEQNNRRNQQQNTRYNRRGVKVVTKTRIVRVGRQRYRETYQIKYLPNGRTQTKVLSRVRIR